MQAPALPDDAELAELAAINLEEETAKVELPVDIPRMCWYRALFHRAVLSFSRESGGELVLFMFAHQSPRLVCLLLPVRRLALGAGALLNGGAVVDNLIVGARHEQ